MQTALSSPHRSASEARRESPGPRRPPRTRPPAPGPTVPSRPGLDRRGSALRRRFVTGCVAFFVAMLVVAGIALLAGHDSPGTLAVLLPLVATYLASSAWLAAVIVLLRSARGPALNAWACGGAVLLVASFVAQIAVTRGG